MMTSGSFFSNLLIFWPRLDDFRLIFSYFGVLLTLIGRFLPQRVFHVSARFLGMVTSTGFFFRVLARFLGMMTSRSFFFWWSFDPYWTIFGSASFFFRLSACVLRMISSRSFSLIFLDLLTLMGRILARRVSFFGFRHEFWGWLFLDLSYIWWSFDPDWMNFGSPGFFLFSGFGMISGDDDLRSIFLIFVDLLTRIGRFLAQRVSFFFSDFGTISEDADLQIL